MSKIPVSIAVEGQAPARLDPTVATSLHVRLRPPRAEMSAHLPLADLDAYIEAVERAIHAEVANLQPQSGQDIEIAITFRDDRPILLQLWSAPGMDRSSLRRLHASVLAVPSPSVTAFTIGFRGAMALWGGTGKSLASARIETSEARTSVDLPSNDGWTKMTFELLPLLLQGDRFVRPGSLAVAVSHWGRKMRLIGEYSAIVPDCRLELSQVLFREQGLRELGTRLLAWSELDFARLKTSPLQLDIELSDPGRMSARVIFDPAVDHPRGDRAECTLIYVNAESSASQRSSLTFRVDLSGVHRFAGDLLAALGPEDVE